MATDSLIEQIATIKQSHPDNLMARYFEPAHYRNLSPDLQTRLGKIIASGIANPDSTMGAYAMGAQDYDDFADLFDPMIRDFHGVPDGEPVAQPHDWDTSTKSCDLGAIDPSLKNVSMRVRVARNARDFPLPGAMTMAQRVEFEDQAAMAFSALAKNSGFGGRYLSITPGSPNEISAQEYTKRVDAHQMFKDMSSDRFLKVARISRHWPAGRGMYISEAEDFIVWVGEEDHLRIMAMQTGGNLNTLFDRLHTGLRILEGLLPEFAMSDKYGAIASCPTNLGAGMRASLHMKLPTVTKNGSDLSALSEAARAHGLAVRGAGGEHSSAGADGLVDISPSARLGVTEMQIMHRLYDGAAALWRLEKMG